MSGTLLISTPVTSGVSEAIEIPSGMYLSAITIPEITSTSFTIGNSSSQSGTYTTLKDCLGTYASAGSSVTFTLGSTAVGTWWIPAMLSCALSGWIKLTFSSSEAFGLTLVFRSIA